MFDQRAQAVAVGADQHLLAGAHLGLDLLLVVGQEAVHGVLEAFRQRNTVLVQVLVDAQTAGVALVVAVHLGRRRVIAAAPDQYLLVAVFLGGFRLVEALQGAVVTLVETVIANHRNPHLVHAVEDGPEGADGALEHRGVGHIEFEAGFLQQLAGLAGFLAALIGEVHVLPAGEAVFLVPDALAVADQYQFGAHGGFLCN